VEELIVVLAGAAVFAGAFYFLRPLLLDFASGEAARTDAQPIPARWRTLLEAAVPQSRHLPAEAQERWLRRTRELIATTRWEGCGGLVLTEEMQLTVAGQAALLTLGLGQESYRRLREVLLYPKTFVASHYCDPQAPHTPDNLEDRPPSLGEAWHNGTVVLSWDSAREGGRNPTDGRNVVYHEFAHQLDFDHGLTADAPASVDRAFVPDPAAWARVLADAYGALAAALHAGRGTVLDAYAATNLAEFFAVATETFFERPVELRAEFPALFAQLASIYRQDPSRWT
jgi:MtfA peptidase